MAKKEKQPKEQKEEKEKKSKKEKKGKAGKGGAPDSAPTGKPGAGSAINEAPLDRSKMTADQLTQAQLEEAIKESQDPASKLKKIRSPLSVRGCLLNILILVVVTIAIVILVCYLMLDHETFDLWVVIKDILDKFKITDFFKSIGAWFKKVFGG